MLNARLKVSELLLIEEICSAFEKEWHLESQHQIAAYVEQAPELAGLLVEQLISLDCELLAAENQAVSMDRYEGIPEQWKAWIDSGVRMWQDSSAFKERVQTQPPERVGEYKIVRVLGRGGMGIVYDAYQEELGRHVAIKMLSGHITSLSSRFKREARAIARLNHPNIVDVYEAGSHEGIPYFAMQLVEGGSLRDLIAEARQLVENAPENSLSSTKLPGHPLLGAESRERIARIGADVARSLQHAHEQSVLHRDIKPSNILYSKDGTPLVTDFGLAKLVDEDDAHTKTQCFAGTLRYAAPERIAGDSEARSDIYSLGLTLYELLVLQPAFPQKRQGDLVNAISGESPKPLRTIESSIPVDLETVIEKATATDPASRYQTAAAFADDLERFLKGTPIKARRASAVEKTWKWIKRKPALAGLIMMVSFFAFVGLPAMAWLYMSERATAEASEQLRKAAVSDNYANSMLLAQQYIERGELKEAKDLLARWQPDEDDREDRFGLPQTPNDLCGWERDYLISRIDSSRITLKSLSHDYIWDVDVSRSGDLIVTVENNGVGSDFLGQIVLWDGLSGRRLKVLASEANSVFQATLSPDEKTLVAVGFSTACKAEGNRRKAIAEIWRLDDSSTHPIKSVLLDALDDRIYRQPHRIHPLRSASYSDDGKHIVFSLPFEVRDASTLECVVGADKDYQHAIAVDERASLVTNGETLLQRDFESAETSSSIALPNLHEQFSLSTDGKLLAVDSEQPFVRIWNSPADLAQRHDVPLPEFAVAKITPDGNYFVRSTDDGRLRIRPTDPKATYDLNVLTGHTSTVTQIAFSQDGTVMATASMDGTAKLWNLAKHTRELNTQYKWESIAAISFADDGETVRYVGKGVPTGATGDSEIPPYAGSWELGAEQPRALKDGRCIEVTYMAKWPRTDFSFSPSGTWLAAPMSEAELPDNTLGFAKSGLGIWSAGGDWELLHEIMDAPETIRATCWNSDETMLGVAGAKSIKLFRVDPANQQAPYCCAELPIDEPARSVAISGSFLAAGFASETRVWKLAESPNSSKPEFSQHATLPSPSKDLSFSPAGKRLAVTDREAGMFRVYEVDSQELLYEQPAPRDLTSIRFSPNGKRIAVTGYESLVYLCDAETGQRLLSLRGSDEAVGTMGVCTQVVFSPDGQRIAVNSWNGRIKVWEVPAKTPGVRKKKSSDADQAKLVQ